MQISFWNFYRKYKPLLLENTKDFSERMPLKDLAFFTLSTTSFLPATFTVLVTKLLAGEERDAIEKAIIPTLLEGFLKTHILLEEEDKRTLSYITLLGDVFLSNALKESNDAPITGVIDSLVNAGVQIKKNNYWDAAKNLASLYSYAFKLGAIVASNKNYLPVLQNIGQTFGEFYYLLEFSAKRVISPKATNERLELLFKTYLRGVRELPNNGYKKLLEKAIDDIFESFREKYPELRVIIL